MLEEAQRYSNEILRKLQHDFGSEGNARVSVVFSKYFYTFDNNLLYKYFCDSSGLYHTTLHLLYVMANRILLLLRFMLQKYQTTCRSPSVSCWLNISCFSSAVWNVLPSLHVTDSCSSKSTLKHHCFCNYFLVSRYT